MKQGYDAIAPIYDALAKLFIGKALRRSQVYFLHHIPQGAKVLIAGGGTGWILEEITTIYQQGLCIDYVDISANMILLAKKRNKGNNKVNFIHQSVLYFSTDTTYDVIITPFVLDNFEDETAQKVFRLLHQTLKQNGLWLYTDFQMTNQQAYWQKVVLFIMYSFFRVAANIEATKLPDVASQFDTYHYRLIKNKIFLHQFISTAVYKKLNG